MSRFRVIQSVTIKIGEDEATIDSNCKWISDNKDLETKLNDISTPLVTRFSGAEHVHMGTNIVLITEEILKNIGGKVTSIKKGRITDRGGVV